MKTKTVKYLAFVLDDESREKLLEACPPMFQDVKAHHVTLISDMEGLLGGPLALRDTALGTGPEVRVVDHRYDEKIQCVGVTYGGSLDRFDGSFHHVTISKDPSARSHQSNLLDEPKQEVFLRLTGSVQILEREI